MTPSGEVSVLQHFDAAGSLNSESVWPTGLRPGWGRTIRGIDGNLYGATVGDSSSAPTVFRVDPSGHVTTLYSFEGAGASSVAGPLAQGNDGVIYGIAFGPGVLNVGGIFKITPTGTFRRKVRSQTLSRRLAFPSCPRPRPPL